ncbi:MAG: TRAP transporter large permease [Oscillospiraceae bacterium]|nr:TRAP transporter large permease [Oscillospiraceae bacterium]
MSASTIGLVGLFAFFVLIALKMPISFAMVLTGFAGFAVLTSPSAALHMVVTEIYNAFTSHSLSVIAMYVWMGYLAYHSGIGTSLYVFAYKMIGHVPGGLAVASQIACAIFGAVCGSNTATAATMGAIALPEMKKYGYDDTLSTASIAAGGALAALIPPSVVFIVYGMSTGQSIGKLFIAGIIPGIMLMCLYIAAILILTKRNNALGPKGPKASWKERVLSLKDGLGETLIIFSLSIGGLFFGWFTPTEAGAIGAGGVLVITALRKKMNFTKLKLSLSDTTKTTAMIMMLIAGAVIFGRFMAISRIPTLLAEWSSSLPLHPYAIFGVVVIIYMILGCFIDALALVLLTVPIFYPVVVDTLGYDPIWFGVVVVLVVAMGVITPPVGMNVYIIKGIAKDVPLEAIFKGVWPFLFCILICITILVAFPPLVMYLPNLLVN